MPWLQSSTRDKQTHLLTARFVWIFKFWPTHLQETVCPIIFQFWLCPQSIHILAFLTRIHHISILTARFNCLILFHYRLFVLPMECTWYEHYQSGERWNKFGWCCWQNMKRSFNLVTVNNFLGNIFSTIWWYSTYTYFPYCKFAALILAMQWLKCIIF